MLVKKKKIDYDFVKGYKCPIVSVPKDIKNIVVEKFESIHNRKPTNNDMLEIDVYYSVDLRNTYEKEE